MERSGTSEAGQLPAPRSENFGNRNLFLRNHIDIVARSCELELLTGETLERIAVVGKLAYPVLKSGVFRLIFLDQTVLAVKSYSGAYPRYQAVLLDAEEKKAESGGYYGITHERTLLAAASVPVSVPYIPEFSQTVSLLTAKLAKFVENTYKK